MAAASPVSDFSEPRVRLLPLDPLLLLATVGLAAASLYTVATAIPPSAAKWVHLVPATNSTAIATAR